MSFSKRFMGKSPFNKYVSDAQRKAVHASKAESTNKKILGDRNNNGKLEGWEQAINEKIAESTNKRVPFKKKGPCWEGYEMIGMKKKGGRMVPNCVPKKK